MGFSDGIMMRDLGRMARENGADTKLVGRPIVEPTALADANFFLEHGMTRAQAEEAARVRRRQDFEANAIADLDGDPPTTVSTGGLGPARAKFAQYVAWRDRLFAELSSLAAKREQLQQLTEAPRATESKIAALIRKSAAVLMGRAQGAGGEAAERKGLDDRLAEEKHLADAAREALSHLEKQIDAAELRAQRIREREAEFLDPALVEAADSIGLGKAYLRKVGELRGLMSLINGLAETAGGYGSGFSTPVRIEFPRTGLPSLADVNDSNFVIPAKGADVWVKFAAALLDDPHADASKFLPKLKG